MALVDKLSMQSIGAACEHLCGPDGGIFERTPMIVPYMRDKLGPASSIERALGPQREFVEGAVVKLDSMQKAGTFKRRGAEVFFKTREREGNLPSSVVTASAGNHAQGVALAAAKYGIQSTIFMPEGAPQVKIDRVKLFGGEFVDVVLEGAFYDESVLAAKERVEETGATYVHAYQDPAVICGQATIAYEIFEKMTGMPQSRDSGISVDHEKMAQQYLEGTHPDVIIVPVGGGGLITGVGMIADHYETQPGRGKTYVVGVQSGAADSMARSFKAEALVPESTDMEATTCADGIMVKSASPDMFGCVRRFVDDIVTVPEGAIEQAIAMVYGDAYIAETQERMRRQNETAKMLGEHVKGAGMVDMMNVVEGAAATPLASLISGAVNLEAYANELGRPVNVVLVHSGSNIDRPRLDAIRARYPL
ncbi:MAG: pyridoxal-phosphate dependent enzyme [Candidatus Woesearchaeota archaeon]|nr:pyridoxal-phosphate dependent enzyme [Candidatus Woesearchaeota archaeon]